MDVANILHTKEGQSCLCNYRILGIDQTPCAATLSHTIHTGCHAETKELH